MNTRFLRAEWNNLVMANFAVPDDVLARYLPHRTQLDHFEEQAYLSLVGFMFLNTKVFGIGIPLHENFEEVNLRFYVKFNHQGTWKRGVVFIKEIVPKKAISFVANNIYGENYSTMAMKHFHEDKGDRLSVGYEWKYKDKWNKLSAEVEKRASNIFENTRECFFADHYWGFTRYSDTKTYHYYVQHPRWQTFKVISHNVDVDFAALYGSDFEFLNKEEPKNILMSKGSQISVQHKMELPL